MTVRVRIDDDRGDALAWTVSPLAELGAALHVLTEPGHHGGLLQWADRILGQLDEALRHDLEAFAFLWRSYRANFLLPARPGQLRDLDEELAELAGLPVDRFANEALQPLRGGGPRLGRVLDDGDEQERVRTYARSRGPRVVDRVAQLIDDAPSARDRVIGFLRGCEEAFFRDEWTRLRPMLLADAQEKSDLTRMHGTWAALSTLAPGLEADRDRGEVVIDKVHEGTIDAVARAVQLIPSAFGWPHVMVQDEPDWPASIQYPARRARPEGPGLDLATVERRLEALADPARLRICRSIVREGRSTQELADIWDLTPPTVSRHLRTLRNAGLVSTERQGHFVLYRLEPDAIWQLGPDLLAALLR